MNATQCAVWSQTVSYGFRDYGISWHTCLTGLRVRGSDTSVLRS